MMLMMKSHNLEQIDYSIVKKMRSNIIIIEYLICLTVATLTRSLRFL